MPRSLRKKSSSATAIEQRLQQSATRPLSTSPNTRLAPPALPAASTQSSQESTQTRSRRVQSALSLPKAASPHPTCHTTHNNPTEAQKATAAALHETADDKSRSGTAEGTGLWALHKSECMAGFFPLSPRSIKKKGFPQPHFFLCPNLFLAVGYGWVVGRTESFGVEKNYFSPFHLHLKENRR